MKCILIGAGATAYCDIANSDRGPPLVRAEDFLRMVKDPLDYCEGMSPQQYQS
jgi:hypothetical protein